MDDLQYEIGMWSESDGERRNGMGNIKQSDKYQRTQWTLINDNSKIYVVSLEQLRSQATNGANQANGKAIAEW